VRIHNHHERRIAAPPNRVGALIDTLSSDDDRLWPQGRWPAMRFDRPLGVGAEGGHAFIRYRVSEYEQGRRVRFIFSGPRGLEGHHEFRVEPDDGATLLSHTITGRASGWFALWWPVAVRPLHDALIEDAFDMAEQAVGTPGPSGRWSWWVRLLRWAARGRR
jgi:hypothetical protein